MSEIYTFFHPELMKAGAYMHKRLFRGFDCAYRCWVALNMDVARIEARGPVQGPDLFQEFVLRFLLAGFIDVDEIALRMGLTTKLLEEVITRLQARGMVNDELVVTDRGVSWLNNTDDAEDVFWEGFAFMRDGRLLEVLSGDYRRGVVDKNMGTEGRPEYVQWLEQGWNQGIGNQQIRQLDLLRALKRFKELVKGADRRGEFGEVPRPMSARIRVTGEWKKVLVAVPACLTADDAVITGDPVFGRACDLLTGTHPGELDEWLRKKARERENERVPDKSVPLVFAGVDVTEFGYAGMELGRAWKVFKDLPQAKGRFPKQVKDFLQHLESGLVGVIAKEIPDPRVADSLDRDNRNENASRLGEMAKDLGFEIDCLEKFFRISSGEAFGGRNRETGRNLKSAMTLVLLSRAVFLQELAVREPRALCLLQALHYYRAQAMHDTEHWETPSNKQMQDWVAMVKAILNAVKQDGNQADRQGWAEMDLPQWSSLDAAAQWNADQDVAQLGLKNTKLKGVVHTVFYEKNRLASGLTQGAEFIMEIVKLLEAVFKLLNRGFDRDYGKILPAKRKEIYKFMMQRAKGIGLDRTDYSRLFELKKEKIVKGKTTSALVCRAIIGAGDSQEHPIRKLTDSMPDWAAIVDRVVDLRGHDGEKAMYTDNRELFDIMERVLDMVKFADMEVLNNG